MMLLRIIKHYAEFVVRYRWLLVLLFIGVTFGLASNLSRLKVDNDPDLWAPQQHDFIVTTKKLEALFGGRNFTVIGVIPKEGDIYTADVLAKIRNIQKSVEALPEAVKHNVISLAARRVKDIQGDADGMVVRDMLSKLPSTEAEADEMRAAIARNPVYINALVSPDGKAAAIVADFRIDKDNPAYAPLFAKLNEIAERERDDKTNILLGGQPVEAANFEFAMQKMPMYFGAAFLIILCVQLLAFRSLQGMFMPLVTAILAVLWGLSFMAIAGVHMDALNSTTPILIMAVASGHSVQILKRYYEELRLVVLDLDQAKGIDLKVASRLAVARTLINVGPVMLAAGTVAVIAFLSMMISDMAMIRNFGFFAGVGIASAVLIELTFTPALRAILPVKQPKPSTSDFVDKFLESLGKVVVNPKSSRTMAIVLGIAVVGLASGAALLKVDSSIRQYTLPETKIRQDSAILNEKFGGTESIFFLIEGASTDAIKDPAVLKAMVKLQQFLEKQPGVGKTQSLADVIRRMNLSMNNENPTFDVIPDSADLISQYMLLYSLSGQPQDFDNLVDTQYKNAVIWTYLKTDSTAAAQLLWKQASQLIAQEFPSGVTVKIGGGLPQTVAINESLVHTKLLNIAQMMLVVFVMASLVFRSLVAGVLVTLPLAAIVLVNLGVMGWLGLPLDMGTATTAAMVTGIGADYEIYMLYRLREEFANAGNLSVALRRSLQTSGRAVLFVALSIAGGYSVLLVADFLFYPRLGGAMILTMLISCVLSLVLLRVVISAVKPKFITNYADDSMANFYLKEKQA